MGTRSTQLHTPPDVPEAYTALFAWRDGRGSASVDVEATLSAIVREVGGLELPADVAEHEWELRFSPMRIKRIGPSLIPTEVVVPTGALAAALEDIDHDVDLPIVIEGVGVAGDEFVLLGFIPHDERTFGLQRRLRPRPVGHQDRDATRRTCLLDRRLLQAPRGRDPGCGAGQGDGGVQGRSRSQEHHEPGQGVGERVADHADGVGRDLRAPRPLGGEQLRRRSGRGVRRRQARRPRRDRTLRVRLRPVRLLRRRAAPSSAVAAGSRRRPEASGTSCARCSKAARRSPPNGSTSSSSAPPARSARRVCPLNLPIEPAWGTMRGALIQDQHKMTFPPFEMMAASMRKEGNIWADYRDDRDAWLDDDLRAKVEAAKGKTNIAYFAGCTASYVEQDIAQGLGQAAGRGRYRVHLPGQRGELLRHPHADLGPLGRLGSRTCGGTSRTCRPRESTRS